MSLGGLDYASAWKTKQEEEEEERKQLLAQEKEQRVAPSVEAPVPPSSGLDYSGAWKAQKGPSSNSGSAYYDDQADPELFADSPDREQAQGFWGTMFPDEEFDPTAFDWRRGMRTATLFPRVALGVGEGLLRDITSIPVQAATAPINWISDDEEAEQAIHFMAMVHDWLTPGASATESLEDGVKWDELAAFDKTGGAVLPNLLFALAGGVKSGRTMKRIIERAAEAQEMEGYNALYAGPLRIIESNSKIVDRLHDYAADSNSNYYERWAGLHRDMQMITPDAAGMEKYAELLSENIATQDMAGGMAAVAALWDKESRGSFDQWVASAQGVALEAVGIMSPTKLVTAPLKAARMTAIAGSVTYMAARKMPKVRQALRLRKELGNISSTNESTRDFIHRALIGAESMEDSVAKADRAVEVAGTSYQRILNDLENSFKHATAGDDSLQLREARRLVQAGMEPEEAVEMATGALRREVEDAASSVEHAEFLNYKAAQMADPENYARASVAQNAEELKRLTATPDMSAFDRAGVSMRRKILDRRVKKSEVPEFGSREHLAMYHEADLAARNADNLLDGRIVQLSERLGRGADKIMIDKIKYLRQSAGQQSFTRSRSMELASVRRDLEALKLRWADDPIKAAALEEGIRRIEKGHYDVVPLRNPLPYLRDRTKEAIDARAREFAYLWNADSSKGEVLGALRANGIAQALDIPFRPGSFLGRTQSLLSSSPRDQIQLAYEEAMRWGKKYDLIDEAEIAAKIEKDAKAYLLARLGMAEVDDSVKKSVESFPFWEKSWHIDGETGENALGLQAVFEDAEGFMQKTMDEISELGKKITEESLSQGGRQAHVLSKGAPVDDLTRMDLLDMIFDNPRMQGLKDRMRTGDVVAEIEGFLGRLKAAKNLTSEMLTANYPNSQNMPMFVRSTSDVAEHLRHKYVAVRSRFLNQSLPGHRSDGKEAMVYMLDDGENWLRNMVEDPTEVMAKWEQFMGTTKSIHYFYSMFHSVTLLESTMASNGLIDGLRMWKAGKFGLPANIARNPRLLASPERGAGILDDMLQLSGDASVAGAGSNTLLSKTRAGGRNMVNQLQDAFSSNQKAYRDRIREMASHDKLGRDRFYNLVGEFVEHGGVFNAPKVEYLMGAPERIFGGAERLIERIAGTGSTRLGERAGRAFHKVAAPFESTATHMEMGLWNQFQGPVKVATYHMLYQRVKSLQRGDTPMQQFGSIFLRRTGRKSLADISDKELKREVAKFVNDEFGSQNWALHNNKLLNKMGKRSVQQVARLVESVDWNLSAARQNWAAYQSNRTLGRFSAALGARPSLYGADATTGIYNPVRGALGLRHSRNTLMQLMFAGGMANYMMTSLDDTEDNSGKKFGFMEIVDGKVRLVPREERRGRFIWENPHGQKAKVATGLQDPFTGKRVYLRPFKALHDAHPWIWSFAEASNFNPFDPGSWKVPTTSFTTHISSKAAGQIVSPLTDDLYGEDAAAMAELRRQGQGVGMGTYGLLLLQKMTGGAIPFFTGRKFGEGRSGMSPREIIGNPLFPASGVPLPEPNLLRWGLFKALPYQTGAGINWEEAKIILTDAFASNDPDADLEIDHMLTDLAWEGWSAADIERLLENSYKAYEKRISAEEKRKSFRLGKDPSAGGF